jgi:hypothetical protein
MALTKCKECGHDISSTADKCPNCGAPSKLKTSKNIGVGCVIALLIILFFVICSICLTPKHSEKAPSGISQKPDLEVITWNWRNEGYSRYIVGSIKNNSGKEYSYVQVEFNLYDKSDAQVGTAFTNISNLEPYGIWKFKALVLEDNATSAKFKGVSGW